VSAEVVDGCEAALSLSLDTIAAQFAQVERNAVRRDCVRGILYSLCGVAAQYH
jgi:hypothetical protein